MGRKKDKKKIAKLKLKNEELAKQVKELETKLAKPPLTIGFLADREENA